MIKIMVDSSADSKAEENLYDMLVPLHISIAGDDYRDIVDLSADRFYELLLSGADFPKTSQPSPEEFMEEFTKVKEAGDELLYFALSSSISGTYQSACLAKTLVDYDKIHIIDTRTATRMISVLAQYAGRRVREGASAQQVAEECEALKGKVRVQAGLDTLEYLWKGGRVSRTSATVGRIADIKPIITVTEEGFVNAGSKAIGVGRAIQTILSKLNALELDDRFPLQTLYTCGTENVERLEKKLEEAGYHPSGRHQVGPTIGAHIGPNIYGVLYVVK